MKLNNMMSHYSYVFPTGMRLVMKNNSVNFKYETFREVITNSCRALISIFLVKRKVRYSKHFLLTYIKQVPVTKTKGMQQGKTNISPEKP